jgi:hypothetical protein
MSQQNPKNIKSKNTNMEQFHFEKAHFEQPRQEADKFEPEKKPEKFDANEFKKRYGIENQSREDLDEIRDQLVRDLKEVNPTDREDIHKDFLTDDDLVVYDFIIGKKLSEAHKIAKGGTWEDVLGRFKEMEGINNEYCQLINNETHQIYLKEVAKMGARFTRESQDSKKKQALVEEIYKKIRKDRPEIFIRGEFFAMLRNRLMADPLVLEASREKREHLRAQRESEKL